MTTPGIVTTEFTDEDAAAALADNYDSGHDSTLVDDHERLLGMTVPGYDPFRPVYDAAWEGFESQTRDDVLTRSNPLSSHAPRTIATSHIAGISAVSGVRVGETTADGVRPVLGGATPS